MRRTSNRDQEKSCAIHLESIHYRGSAVQRPDSSATEYVFIYETLWDYASVQKEQESNIDSAVSIGLGRLATQYARGHHGPWPWNGPALLMTVGSKG